MAIFLARRWTRQPQVPVVIDWGNSLTNKLIYGALASNGFYDMVGRVSNDRYSSSSSNWGHVKASSLTYHPTMGRSYQTEQSVRIGIRIYDRDSIFDAAGGPITFFVQTSYDEPAINTSTVGQIFGHGSLDTTNQNVNSLGQLPDGRFTFFSRGTGSSIRYVTAPSAVGENVPTFLLGERYTGGFRFFQNNIQIGSSTYNIGLENVNSPGLMVGQNPYLAGSYIGKLPFAYCWSRLLSESEKRAIHENPYQILRETRPKLFFLPSAAPPAEIGTQVKVWNGTAWETHPIKVFMSGSWQQATIKRHNGSTWERI